MGKTTEINKVNVDIRPAFFKEYNIFKIKVNHELWKKMDRLDFDAFCGMGAKGDVYLYVLTKEPLLKVRNKLEEHNIPFATIAETANVSLKLLVNSICREPGFAVLEGKNYCLLPVSFYRGEKLCKVVDIPEIWASKDNVLSIHSVRFIRYDAEYNEGMPAFRFEDGCLRREFFPDNECFVKHGLPDRKAKSLEYLNTTVNGYLKSRVAVIRMVVDLINKKYEGLLNVSFCTAADVFVFRGERAVKYRDILDDNIVQHFRDGVSSDIPEVYEYYDIPRKGSCRLRLIEDKDAYAEGKDEYARALDVQHITRPSYLEALEKGRLKPIIRGCLTELAIKQDIRGSIDCFSGYIHSLDDTATFYLRKSSSFCFAKKTGMFLEFGTFSLNDPPSWVCEEVLDAKESHIIERGCCVLGLKETDMFPITGSDAWTTICQMEGNIRGKDLRDETIGSLIDAHLFEIDGRRYYFSSVIGNGMQSSIPKADTLMKIVEYKKDMSYEWLLPYICVTYINAGNRFTKYPYPFKYIKEWAVVNGCEWVLEM